MGDYLLNLLRIACILPLPATLDVVSDTSGATDYEALGKVDSAAAATLLSNRLGLATTPD